jgi:NADH dehydrogenase [ubiquinone] 1 alpha subcomplex assembly factor 7
MSEPKSLQAELLDRIATNGPIPLPEFMQAAVAAYYARGDVFGARGDFITAPEISQTFGELIGLWAAVAWQAMGAPTQIRLIECGPGRGTLMADLLRAARTVPAFAAAVDVHLIEQSERLREGQRAALGEMHATWHEDLATVPAGPAIVIANEFLDALPIRQFERIAHGWGERFISASNGAFTFTLCPTDALGDLDAPFGTIVEQSPAVEHFVESLAARLVREGGVALLIDYGYAHAGFGDTLQALRDHRFHPVLEDVGDCDLTAHVNFAAVTKAAKSAGAQVFGPVDQGVWLERLGIDARLARLASGKPPAVRQQLESGVQRLTDPQAMGSLFKVVALAHAAGRPEGFA